MHACRHACMHAGTHVQEKGLMKGSAGRVARHVLGHGGLLQYMYVGGSPRCSGMNECVHSAVPYSEAAICMQLFWVDGQEHLHCQDSCTPGPFTAVAAAGAVGPEPCHCTTVTARPRFATPPRAHSARYRTAQRAAMQPRAPSQPVAWHQPLQRRRACLGRGEGGGGGGSEWACGARVCVCGGGALVACRCACIARKERVCRGRAQTACMHACAACLCRGGAACLAGQGRRSRHG